MIGRHTYRQFLNTSNPVQSSINLSFPNAPAHPHPHDLSPNITRSKREGDRQQTTLLDIMSRLPDDPRVLRHTCSTATTSSSNLNSSFGSSHPPISPKKVGQSTGAKQARPASSFRPSNQDHSKQPLSGFSSKLELSTCGSGGRPEVRLQSSEIEGRGIGQAREIAKLGREDQMEREIERLKELRSRRMENNADIMIRFEDKIKTDPTERIPRSTVNLSNKENKSSSPFTTASNLDRSFQAKDKPILLARPLSTHPDPSIFTPIQFRKKSTNHAYADSKLLTDYLADHLSKSPLKKQPIPLKPEPAIPQSLYLSQAPKPQRQRERKVSLSDFALGKKLGQGRFGCVWMAVHKSTGGIFALKKIWKSTIRQNLMVQQFILEVKIQLFVEHAYVVRLFGVFDDEESIYLLLEYLEGGTLYGQLKLSARGRLPEPHASAQMAMICDALRSLHQKGIAHRDIKPENVIITNDVCKLADFGWATLCDQRRKTYCGTTDYVAPEIVEGLEYDISVDLWCVGVLAYELLAGRAPFYHISRQETFNRIKNVDTATLTFPDHFSTDAADFIGRLIKKNPDERMDMAEAVSHPFLTKYHL